MKIILFSILFVSFLSLGLVESDALRQVGGPEIFEINPGETFTFEWKLIASDENPVSLVMGARGWGSQFVSFPETLELGPFGEGIAEITVTIPNDHPGGVVLKPVVTATQFGERLGTIRINVQAEKVTEITINPNENPDFRLNTAYDEPEQILEEPKQIATEQEEKIEEEKKGFEGGSLSIGTPSDEEQQKEEGGGCLIATAAYGSEIAQQVQLLREIRDDKLLTTASGSSFMSGFNSLYYSFSPAIADLERENPMFREAVKLTITPLLTSLSLLNYVDMDSEAEVLGYGISLILLNTAMYFVAPAIVITQLRKRF